MPSLQLVDTTAPAARPEITDAEGAAMARAVVNLFERWRLTDRQATTLLGGLSPRSWARWKDGQIGRLDRDRKARLSNLMGIHKALRLIFPEPARAYGWPRRPNAAFGGRTGLDVMLDGELTDLMRVRRYLDAERGLW
ncbi:MAG: MbcA/ParS/Xre antitoxin family protein [Pseudomonadota bacterium]